MSSKRWQFGECDEGEVRQLAEAARLKIPIARVLVQRGFISAEQADSFLQPRLSGLSDPFLLPDMKTACSRIWQAIDSSSRIVVFGDYDVDGVTSSALLTRVLRVLGANVVPFIPDRMDEGYGLSSSAMTRCLEDHTPNLIISVDCGVNSVTSIEQANQAGVDVIVTDHHEPEEKTAPALAVVNPKLGSLDELKKLSGVGVAFKLAHALVKEGRRLKKPSAATVDLRDYLDIVALGTVADIVPLEGENRILVRYGLSRMRESKWVGLTALKDKAGVKGHLETFHLGFQLGPRINAAGRIGQPMEALELLLTQDAFEARRISRLLDETNAERRRIEHEMADDAFVEIEQNYNPETHFGLVVAHEQWHPGVVGIVASRISRHYNRPAIIMGIEEDGAARGSCRSISEYNLLDGLQACSDLLNKFGGHKMAAGLEVKSGALEEFKVRFNQAVQDSLAGIDLTPVQAIDAVVHAADLDWEFYKELRQLHPFGECNREPVWSLEQVELASPAVVVGKKHLKMTLIAEGKRFAAIAFNYALEELPQDPFDVAFTLKENSWMGDSSLQLQIQDVRSSTMQVE